MSSNSTENQSSNAGRVQIPVNSGIYTFKNERFGKALYHLADSDGVVGFGPHEGNNQRWILEQEGGGWIIRSKLYLGTYLGLRYDNSYSNGQEVSCVDHARRLIWEVQPAANNTVRLALHSQQRHITSTRLRSKNLDIDERMGTLDGTKVKLWDHVENASRQRWIMEYEGQPLIRAQTRANVPTGPVYIVNNRYKNVVDRGRMDGEYVAHGIELHGGRNQHWTFEPAGCGYAIATVTVDPLPVDQLRYLGLSPNNASDNSRLAMVAEENRVIWTVQSARDNTVRIARMDHPNWCLQMSGAGNYQAIVLFSHAPKVTDQRWEFRAA